MEVRYCWSWRPVNIRLVFCHGSHVSFVVSWVAPPCRRPSSYVARLNALRSEVCTAAQRLVYLAVVCLHLRLLEVVAFWLMLPPSVWRKSIVSAVHSCASTRFRFLIFTNIFGYPSCKCWKMAFSNTNKYTKSIQGLTSFLLHRFHQKWPTTYYSFNHEL